MAEADDVALICQLKYRYVRTLDTRKWDEFERCLHPEVTADYAGLTFSDRTSLVDFMRSNLPSDLYTMHHVHGPEISVDGDQATGIWYLQDKVIYPAMNFMLEGAAIYEDRYERTAGGWQISATGYQRTFELHYDLAAQPGLTIKGPAQD